MRCCANKFALGSWRLPDRREAHSCAQLLDNALNADENAGRLCGTGSEVYNGLDLEVKKEIRDKVKEFILAIVLVFWPMREVAQSYATSFALIENPISERGAWVGGQSAGGNLWGDVRTSGGMAYGVSEPTKFGDPTAILTGSWAANQQAQATVKINKTPTVCCHEIEVRLRVTISANSITGYEVYCSIVPGSKYCHIARWSGPNGMYCNIEPSSPGMNLVNGDVLMGTVTGSNPALITGYLNGVQIMQVSDTGNEGGE